MKRWLLVVALTATPALAAEGSLEREFPSGSIRTREQAASAMRAAHARHQAIEQAFKTTNERCTNQFMVTQCRNDARNRHNLDLREVERVRLEAREVTRRLDAQQRAARRAEEDARRAAESPAETKRAEDSRQAFEARQRAAGERDLSRPPPARKTPAPPSISRQPSAEERAENMRRLQEKQRAAQEHARVKAAERAENEQRRAARRQERLDEERAAAAAK